MIVPLFLHSERIPRLPPSTSGASQLNVEIDLRERLMRTDEEHTGLGSADALAACRGNAELSPQEPPAAIPQQRRQWLLTGSWQADYRALASECLGDRRGEGRAGLAIELAGRPTDSKALPIRGFGDDVEVDMEDGLMGPRAVVLEEVELGGSGRGKDGAGDSGQNPTHRRGAVITELVERCCGFLGDDQGVTGAEGKDVKEGKDVGILVDLVTGNLASDDSGEDGLSHAPSVAAAKRGWWLRDGEEMVGRRLEGVVTMVA